MTLYIPRHVPVAGYEGLYEILEDGRVWGLKRRKFLKPGLTGRKGNQYRSPCLCKDGIQDKPKIHRLVALHFIRSPDPVTIREVDHRDRNRENNTRDNLRWVTHSENMMNKSLSKNNTSGKTGVQWRKDCNKWVVQFTVDKKRTTTYHNNKQDAIDHRAKMEKLHYVERD